MITPTVSGANANKLTIVTDKYGVFGTRIKFLPRLSSSALSTNVINVELSITPSAGETLLLTAPVTVGN